MKNAFRILRRDILRLVSVPAAWVIIVGLCILPSLYAWFNIVGFWDPYGYTKTIEVSVANADTGTSNEALGELNLGDQIISTLKKNDQMGWKFTSTEQALNDVNSGASYAAIVIPADFSKNVASIVSGDFTKPQLQYYINEKLSAIAPKVTDVGANTIDNQVNSTFVSTVSKVVATTFKTKIAEFGKTLDTSRLNVGTTLRDAQAKVSTAQGNLTHMSEEIDGSRANLGTAKKTLNSTKKLLVDASAVSATSSDLLNKIAGGGASFSSSAISTLNQGSSLFSQISSSTNGVVNSFSTKVMGAQGQVAGTLSAAQSIATSNGQTVDNLIRLVNTLPMSESVRTDLLNTLNRLKTKNQQNATLLSNLTDVNNGVGSATTALNSTSNNLNTAIHSTASSLNALGNNLATTTLPSLNASVSGLSATTGQLSGSFLAQTQLIDQANLVLTDLDTVLKNTSTALKTAAGTLGDIDSDLDTLATDVSALGSSALWSTLLGITDIDSSKVSSFMASPTKLKEDVLYPVATYGSAMAPLFTNLALWIGAFVLVVILKLEIDGEGIENLTGKQAYMGRWLLFACFSILQALIVTIGDLIIGVQTVNAFAFIATGVLVSLAYLSIIYALSKSFAHVGKGICVLLVMVQIPGASGLYPIEMMPDFFRILYPLMPFTYGIDMMRETIGGFYDGYYAMSLAKLMIFVALAFGLGLVLRKYLTNVNRLFADELDQTEIYVGEKSEVPPRSYRLSQIIRALVDRQDFTETTVQRAHNFAQKYPKLKRGGLIAGFIVPVILAIFSTVSSSNKPVILGLWVIWILIVIGYLLVIEYVRESISSQVSLGSMDEASIRTMLLQKYTHGHKFHLHTLLSEPDSVDSASDTAATKEADQ